MNLKKDIEVNASVHGCFVGENLIPLFKEVHLHELLAYERATSRMWFNEECRYIITKATWTYRVMDGLCNTRLKLFEAPKRYRL